MCCLCSKGKELESAKKELLEASLHLGLLADMLAELEKGDIEPHSSETCIIRANAVIAIRYLAKEWL